MAYDIEQLKNTAAKRPKAGRFIFICSPLKGDIPGNRRKAARFCRFVMELGHIPIAPHLYFTEFLDDRRHPERNLGIAMGRVAMTRCDELWAFGTEISTGMRGDIDEAIKSPWIDRVIINIQIDGPMAWNGVDL